MKKNNSKPAKKRRSQVEMEGLMAGAVRRIPTKHLKRLIGTSEGAERRVWSGIAKSQTKFSSKAGARA